MFIDVCIYICVYGGYIYIYILIVCAYRRFSIEFYRYCSIFPHPSWKKVLNIAECFVVSLVWLKGTVTGESSYTGA